MTESRKPATTPSTLYICGAGVRIPGHLTVETMGILRGCTTIYCSTPSLARSRMPSELAIRFHPVAELGRGGPAEQAQSIERMLDDAIANAPVAYLTQGNPALFDPMTREIVERAKKRGVAVDVRPAVSSIDSVLVDLQLDLQSGLQLFDAGAFVGRSIRPRADLDCLLIDPCPENSGLIALGNLQEHLLQYYPANHLVTFVASATAIGERTRIQRFAIDELVRMIDPDAARNATLYVPAITMHTIVTLTSDQLPNHSAVIGLPRKGEFQA